MKSAILSSKRKHVAVMRKATKVLLFISLSFLFTFTSCQNIFEDSVSDSESHTVQTDENNNQLPEQKQNGPAAPAAPVVIPKVSFKGSLNVNGALPEKMEKVLADPSIYDEEALEDENSSVFARLSRAARPKLPAVGSAYEYFVKATDQTGLSKEAVPQLDPDDNKYKYKLELEINKTWTFQAGFRKKAVGEEGDPDYEPEKILLIDTETEVENSYAKTLNEVTPTTTHNFVLKPMKTPDGKGRLQLLMETIPPEVTQLKLFVPDENDGHAVQWLSDDILEIALHSSTTSITSSTGVAVNNYIRSKDDAFNIPSGAYDVTLIFYKSVTGVTEPVPCYITCQTINIFDNMVTDSWINESGASADGAINTDGAIDSITGVFTLSNDLMQNFLETTIYVGQLAGGTVSASDGNTGSAYSPLATLGRAFELIQVQGNGSPYRIYITGNQTGNFTIPSGIGTTQASSIEISGIGNTPSVLDGNKAGTVLKVDSAVPVTLKNIRITNGKAESGSPTSGKGGGIYIASGASVTLGTDAIIGGIPAGVTSAAISENSSSNYALSGGGVYCEGSLILKRGSEVSYNYASDSSFENGGGGGIRCKNGTLKIEDGSKISMNGSANAGAGIALEATDFIMTGGLVSDNRNNNSGGGIYNSACTRFVISGGVISGNHANTGGGLSISNGTTTESVISGNTLIEKNSSGSLGRGGGIYVSSGILNLQGVTIKNNTSVSTYPGGAVAVSGTATFKISGSTYIPYGVATSTETGVSTETGPGKNDIYLDSGKTITLESDLSRHTASDRLFVTLPAANWVRSTSVVTAATGFTITDTIKDKIGYTSAGWISSIESNTIKLDSPIYVKNGGSASATGTSADPFDNIQHALSAMTDSNKDYVIYVDGTVTGSQTIPAENLSSFSARSITIEGVNNGTLDGQSCNANVLKIEATCDVTIRNLTIKGAYFTTSSAHGGGILSNTSGKLILASGTTITENTCARDGGGVEKAYGTLEIQDGVEISRNTAGSGGGIATMNSATVIMSGGVIKGNKSTGNTSDFGGGGVYLNGGKFFIYGNALIGTDNASLTDYTVENGCNVANYGGGGICITASAAVYIGYKGLDSSDNPVLATGEEAFTGGIMGNYGAFYGGGIYDNFGTKLVIGAGKISNNKTATSGCGGAIFTSINTTLNTIIRGGEISGNIAGKGGAIYNNGTLKLEAGAKIPGAGTAGSNDIFLNAAGTPLVQRFVTVAASTFTYHNTSNNPIYLTLQTWKRGSKILEAADSSVTISTASNYFKLTEGGWEKTPFDTDLDGTYDTVKITSPLYVAGSDGRVACSAPPASGACGTIAKPYARIADALAASDLAEAGYTITIDGTVTGAQTISGLASSVSGITLTGYKASGETSSSAKLKRFATMPSTASDDGSTLTIDASGKTIEISDLSICGGNATNGGGINITAGTVTLSNGAKVYGNKATNGGGVYLAASGATLNMQGTAIIGDTRERTAGNSTLTEPTSSDIGCANSATNGGGIYSNGGNVYVGCDSSGSSTIIMLSSDGGVRRNFASYGGGVYIGGGIFMTGSGQISYNYAYKGAGIYTAAATGHKILGSVNINNNKTGDEGGGLYIASGSTVSMSGSAKITKNNAVSGGGVAIYGTFNMSSGTIGGDSSESGNTSSSGGGVDISVENSSPYPAGTFNMTGGTISYNSCGNNGGGIAIGSRTKSGTTYNGTANISGGIISNNKASSNGGAILQDGILNISGDVSIPYGVTIDGTETKSPGNNDVYLFRETRTITVASTTLGGGTSVATVTPASWKRGTNIIEWLGSPSDAQKTTIKGQIKLSKDDGGWNREEKTVSGKNYVCINSPIYVAGSTGRVICSAPPASGNNGTISSPYATIAAALGCTELSAAGNLITIDGTIGKQEIAPSASLSAVTIAGYKAGSDTTSSAKIDAGGTTGAGSALTVNKSGLTVTITDLTITGGTGTGTSTLLGGGIYLKNGMVLLGDGSKVTGNTATNGGGVYVDSTGTLLMYGKALIGDSATSTTTATGTSSSTYANKASLGGGIYNNGGKVFLGYILNSSGNPTKTGGALYDADDGHYGVRRNYGSSQGGGFYHSGGTFQVANGSISYNLSECGGAIYNASTLEIEGGAKLTGNSAATSGANDALGGAIYNNGTLTISGNVTMTGNSATTSSTATNAGNAYGGAIYNQSILLLAKGTIGGDGANQNTVTSTGKGLACGGAIYQGGTFCPKGNGFVYPGSLGTNDVYLPDGKYVKFEYAYDTGASQSSNPMTLTLPTWTRGTQVLDGTGNFIKNYYTYFACSDTEYKVGYYVSGTVTADAAKVIGADIWVASSLSTGHNRTTGVSAPPASDRKGTKAAPYATITEAVGSDVCWSSDYDFTINVTGHVETTSRQEIASTVTAKSITITGARGNTYDIIDRGRTSTVNKGNVLKIATAVPVTIKDLKITGGYSTNTLYDADGGGIYVSAKGASLTLASGALITGNTSNQGGGVYIEGSSESGGKANLYMISGSQVSGNKAASAGGGVYLSYANLCMTGTALVGSTANSAAATATDGDSPQHSNWASDGSGGGVYASNGGVYMGYKTASTASSAEESLSNGIGYNYANQNGGGLFLASGGVLYMKTGYIRRNGTIINASSNGQGGGVCVYDGATVSIQGGTIGSNAATQGGGMYFANNNTVAAGTISGNTASASGGGIYIASGKTVTLQAVAVTENYVTTTAALSALYGGGVHNAGTLKITGASSFTGNYVNTSKSNAYGGAISNYNASSTIEISGSVTMNGNYTKSTAATADSKEAFGGAIYNAGKLTMSAGSIGTSTKNYVSSNSEKKYGGAIYQKGSFIVSGNINLYNSGNAAGQNDVYLTSGKTVELYDNITTSGSGYVMTVTPDSYSIGRKIVAEPNTEYEDIASNVRKTIIGRIALVKSGIYSKVEVSQPVVDGIQGVVGIDFNAVRVSDITNYMTGKEWTSASGGTAISYGLSYYFLKHTNGRIGILKLDRTKTNNNEKTGNINAERVIFASTGTTSAGTVSTYGQISYNTAEHYIPSGMFPYAYNNSGDGWDVFNTSDLSIIYNGNAVYIVQPVGEYSLAIQYLQASGGNGITGYKVQ